MAIHFISGKPGGGKTLYAVKMIVGELTTGSRTIVTNVPLLLGVLQEYLAQVAPRKLIDVNDRIIMLDDDQTKEFWRTRPGWTPYQPLTKEQWTRGLLPSYSEITDNGILYVIDEVHTYFGSRQWAETGRDAVFYLSQHRKLGDDVICITQALRNVDRIFRSLAQDFTHVRNFGKEKFGIFRMPSIFLRKVYGCEPTPTACPMETKTFTLDASGLAKCYNTAAGIGIHARLADTAEKTKGFPAWTAVALVVAIVVGVAYAVPPVIGSAFKTTTGPHVPVNALHAPVAPAEPALLSPVVVVPVVPGSNSVYWLGHAQISASKLALFLSDGRTLYYPQDRRITEITADYFILSNQRFERK